MIKDIFFKLLPELDGPKKDSEYTESVFQGFKKFMETSQIPEVCYGFEDIKVIPPKINNVYKNIRKAVEGRYTFLFDFYNFDNIPYIAYLFLLKYFQDCIETDNRVETILYIDTNLLLADYKKLIDYKDPAHDCTPTHSTQTLLRDIEIAPLVIWDKFTFIKSMYDKDKMYELMSIRERQGLGNFYFIRGGTDSLSGYVGPDITSAILAEMSLGFRCGDYKYSINKAKEVNDFK